MVLLRLLGSRRALLCFQFSFRPILRLNAKWFSSISPKLQNIITSCEKQGEQQQPSIEFWLVSVLKSCSSSLSAGQQIHAFALKSGIDRSNIFVRNGLINLYGKCGCLDLARYMFLSSPLLDTASWNIMLVAYVKSHCLEDACILFDEMPNRDCVSFTTMIMGLTQNGHLIEALTVFQDMVDVAVMPNEVTLASVISTCSHLHAIQSGRMVHAMSIRNGLDVFVLVSTNLVHMYATCLCLEDSKTVFNGMQERNIVTWNAMLNGYAKAGLVDLAKDLFERMTPIRDMVSWGTMIDGYLRADRLEEALFTYGEMLQDEHARLNEVMLVDLVSACGRLSTIQEGRQLHAVILKTGLDSHSFVQATLIHFYAACQQIDLACVLFRLGNKDNISSWNALIVGFLRNNMVDSARQLFDEMPEKDVVSWSTLISGYVQTGQSDLALELFHEMQFRGTQPNEITLVSVLSAVASSGTLEQGKWIHNYIRGNSIPLNDNLSAGLIDMYAKCGSIRDAMRVFNHLRDESTSISPWNAIICGLAMHGLAEMSLNLFVDLQRTSIRPNSVTFIGVLSACCHAGLVKTGKRYFECMKNVYNIEPNIKHYGCMVDLLGRAGCLEEAERLIEAMPMKADVVIWGTMLASSRTHSNVEIGERAAESLARLEPSHGAGRVLLSNIYADAGRWDDVVLVRRAMQSRKLKKLPGCSGIL